MKKVILTVGLPASGKSTWAKKTVDGNPGSYKRVNKDDLRAMLDNSKHSRGNEKFVLKIRDNIILEALEDGKHVIVDDTNLNKVHHDHIKELVKGLATVEVKDFTDVDFKTCIERDLKRAVSVGQKVIMGMYNKYLKPETEKPKKVRFHPDKKSAVMCDLDGTLALMNGRSPYDGSKCNEDLLNTPVADTLKRFSVTHDIVLMSGREDQWKPQTLEFLEKYEIPYTALYMRKSGDIRKDSIIKEEMFRELVHPTWNIEFVLDDRDQVVNMWRSIGLNCFQVAPGDF